MEDLAPLGRLFLGLGILFLLIGALFLLSPRLPWLGRLPGDITIQRQNFTCWAPIATSIILSIVLTIGLNLLLWLLRRFGGQ
jgi:uncharacterized protein HemY